MSIDATFKIDLRIFDKAALYSAARERYIRECGNRPPKRKDISEMLGTKRDPDIAACLVMLFDPGSGPDGISIDHSYAEVHR
jgi:hypothetical protein